MMKFAANHPLRFHKKRMWLAWTTGLMKVLVIVSVEMLNILGLIQKCSVTSTVMGYLKYFIIASFDTYMFKSLENEDKNPFEAVVNKGSEILIIDRTRSLKNSWAYEEYTETLLETDKDKDGNDWLPPYKTMSTKEEIQK